MRFKLPSLFPEPEPVTKVKDEEQTQGATLEKRDSKDSSVDSSEIDTSEFQTGVLAVQASSQVWTKKQLIFAYFLIWILQFILALSSGINATLTPYVTSAFNLHSMTATVQVGAYLAAGIFILPYAKLLNVWGRPQSFALMICSMTLGLLLMAVCKNVGTYCIAQVFYQVGSTAVTFTMTIFIADTSSLRNRAFYIAFSASPWVATVWAYGPASQSILKTIGFRWNFGIWAIVIPIVASPLFAMFYYNLIKARKSGLIPQVENNRTFKESVIYYLKEFDVVGVLLLCAGLTIFLLSFSIHSYQADGWKSPLIICFIVFGVVLVVLFGFWEKYYAPVTFIPWSLLTDRTIVSTYTMCLSLYMAWYVWDGFFYSYLVVVYELTVSQATYISNIYTIGATFWSLVMGVIIRYNGRLKWQALYFGAPITALGVGLMIHFRQPDTYIGYIVMCQIFIAFGGGTLVICQQMSVMSVVSHQYVPIVLSMENLVVNIGSSIGVSIAGAMWTELFPKYLAEKLPESVMGNLANIYGDITVQQSYPSGTPERDAINDSYSAAQRIMLITATSLYIITFVSIMFWKDVDVRRMKKISGYVL